MQQQLLIGAATVVEAAYEAAATHPDNPQVQSTMRAGIKAISSGGLTQFHSRTPTAPLREMCVRVCALIHCSFTV
eukprot:14221801-Alexandrium_andersonii.AAC.1